MTFDYHLPTLQDRLAMQINDLLEGFVQRRINAIVVEPCVSGADQTKMHEQMTQTKHNLSEIVNSARLQNQVRLSAEVECLFFPALYVLDCTVLSIGTWHQIRHSQQLSLRSHQPISDKLKSAMEWGANQISRYSAWNQISVSKSGPRSSMTYELCIQLTLIWTFCFRPKRMQHNKQCRQVKLTCWNLDRDWATAKHWIPLSVCFLTTFIWAPTKFTALSTSQDSSALRPACRFRFESPPQFGVCPSLIQKEMYRVIQKNSPQHYSNKGQVKGSCKFWSQIISSWSPECYKGANYI